MRNVEDLLHEHASTNPATVGCPNASLIESRLPGFPQPVPLRPRLSQQGSPIIGRLAAFQHAAKYPIRIIAAFIGMPGILIIHPGKNQQLARRMEAKELPVLLKKLGAPPMLVLIAKRAASPIFCAGRVLRGPWSYRVGSLAPQKAPTPTIR